MSLEDHEVEAALDRADEDRKQGKEYGPVRHVEDLVGEPVREFGVKLTATDSWDGSVYEALLFIEARTPEQAAFTAATRVRQLQKRQIVGFRDTVPAWHVAHVAEGREL